MNVGISELKFGRVQCRNSRLVSKATFSFLLLCSVHITCKTPLGKPQYGIEKTTSACQVVQTLMQMHTYFISVGLKLFKTSL